MNSIGWIFIIAAVILITLSVVTVTVFLILILVGIKKAVVEFGKVITKINSELDDVNKISDIVSMRRKLSSLVIGGVSFLFYTFLSISKKNRTHRK
jgi:uncharacterized membrane protein YbaN (DUF454 family)